MSVFAVLAIGLALRSQEKSGAALLLMLRNWASLPTLQAINGEGAFLCEADGLRRFHYW